MQYLGNKPVQGIGRTKNLFNEDLLVEWGAQKLASGEYYVAVASSFKNVVLWKNTNSYQGQVVFDYDVKYINDMNAYIGLIPYIRYTDGSTSVRSPNNIFEEYQHFSIVSDANKIVDNIYFSYQTGSTQTYLKNIMINYGDIALPYQPYLQRYDMYMYDNLIKLPYYNSNNYTHNGITWTVDEQTGWIIANGTCVNNVSVYNIFSASYANAKPIQKGKYIFNVPSGADYSTTYYGNIRAINSTGNSINLLKFDARESWTFDIPADDYRVVLCLFGIRVGYTANNLVFKPELIKLIGD